MRWVFNWAMRLVTLDRSTPTWKQRTGCRSSSVSGQQRHQRWFLQQRDTHRLVALTSNSSPTSGVQPLGDVISSYTAVVGELRADDYTGAPSCTPIVHVEVMIQIMMTAHCQVLADEILVDCSKNCQSAKINSLPNFPAIPYTAPSMEDEYIPLQIVPFPV